MLAVCTHCKTRHELPAASRPDETPCAGCGGRLVSAKPAVCRACRDEDASPVSIYIVPRDVGAWTCREGHINHG